MEFYIKSPKIKTKKEISEIINEIRKNNFYINIITTNGAFDLLHINHIYSLRKVKSFGDILVVGLNSDKSIKKYKSKDRPIINEEERAELIASLDCVDYVVIFDETDPRDFLKYVKPDIHVKSYEGYKGIEEKIVKDNGGIIALFDHRLGNSQTNTSDLIKRIKELKD